MTRSIKTLILAAPLGAIAGGIIIAVADATEDAAPPQLSQTRPDRYSENTYCDVLDNSGSLIMAEVVEVEHYERAPTDQPGVSIMRRVRFQVAETYVGDSPTTFTQFFSGGTVGDRTVWTSMGYQYPIEEGARFLLLLRFQEYIGQPPRKSGSEAVVYYMAQMPSSLPVDISTEEAQDIYAEHCDPLAPPDLIPTAEYHSLLPLSILEVCEHY